MRISDWSSDVCSSDLIIGGGIVGITTARLLKDAGFTVTVIEAREVGRQVTGKSTAKITSQHSIIYQTLARTFGEDGARLYAEAQETAIVRIRSRPEASRGAKECVSTCRSRWSPEHETKKKKQTHK